MENNVLIDQVITIPKRINLIVESKYTYFHTEFEFTFCIGKTKIVSIKSQCFDLFEGKQILSINHDVVNLDVNDLILIIEIHDQTGTKIGYFEQFVNDERRGFTEPRPLIESMGELTKLNEGGCIRISVGDVTFKIHAHHKDILNRCKDYMTQNEPDCDISINEDEIIDLKRKIFSIYNYLLSDSEAENIAVRNRVSESIIDYNGFQIHGAAIAVDNQCYIFTADSGIGKTTHIKLWLKHLKNAFVVNGDHPIIRTEPNLLVYGSPWCGKEKMNKNVAVPLKAIIIMERDSRNEITEIGLNEAVIDLLRQVHKSSNPIKVKKTLELLSSLDRRVKFYKFRFNNFSEDAFRVSYGKIHSC